MHLIPFNNSTLQGPQQAREASPPASSQRSGARPLGMPARWHRAPHVRNVRHRDRATRFHAPLDWPSLTHTDEVRASKRNIARITTPRDHPRELAPSRLVEVLPGKTDAFLMRNLRALCERLAHVRRGRDATSVILDCEGGQSQCHFGRGVYPRPFFGFPSKIAHEAPGLYSKALHSSAH
jgi:hypothetical protein